MRMWRNARIRTKVVSGLLVAAVGLVCFATVLIVDNQRRAAESAGVGTLAGLSVTIGDLLHETQRERGRTAQFTSSKGASFGAELTAQQASTDTRLAEFEAFTSRHAGD